MQRIDINDLLETGWSGPALGKIGTAVAKLRCVEEPFTWHCNTGRELFLLIDGRLDMHVRVDAGSAPEMIPLLPGQMLIIEAGEEHVAHPRCKSRVLVIEEDEREVSPSSLERTAGAS